MKKVIIYPGRFQPMLSHHAEVYDRLQAENPGVDVYFGTSNKVEDNKSPFSFKEKQLIASAQGIDPNKVLLANRPYVWEDYAKYFDAENTHIFFAVGEKDMQEDPRFTFNNIDPKSGLDMKLRPNKDTKEIEPKYYQMINSYKDDPRPMSQRGYIMQTPNVMSSGEDIASASAFRKALIDAPDKESAKEIFKKQFKEYKESIFDLLYNKIVGDKMNEDMNILRQLAGLSVSEDAPVEFDTPLKPEKIKFAPVSKSSAVMSIANRFPAGSNVNDPEVKKEQFLKALLRSPASLLSEINERIMPDENGLEVSKKLSEIIDSMRDKGLMDLEKEDKAFALKIIKIALKKMKLDAGDDRDFDPESGALEGLDLSDVRDDYGIEEDEEIAEGGDCYHCDGKDEDCEHCDGDGYVKFDDDPNEPSQEEMDKHAKKESAPFSEPSQREEQYNTLITAYENGEEDLAEVLGLSMQELDQEMTEFAMEHGLHMDDDRDEVVQGYIEQVVDNADYKDHGEYESIEENAGEYSYTLEYNGEENGMSKHKLSITSPEGETKEIADDFTYFDVEGDELQAELESWFHKGMGVADASANESIEEAKCSCCGNEITDEGCGCDADCPHCGGVGKVDEAGCGSHKKKKKSEAVEDTTAKALEAAMAELRTLAGLI